VAVNAVLVSSGVGRYKVAFEYGSLEDRNWWYKYRSPEACHSTRHDRECLVENVQLSVRYGEELAFFQA
jgi:hypothetical protein